MMKIGNRIIGEGSSVFVIAEAGVNHNGEVNLAKRLIDEAVLAGVDAIKFQTFRAKNLVTGYANMARYQKDNLGVVDSQYSMLKKLELSYEDFKNLKAYCDEKGIIFMSTPFDIESANYLHDLGVEAFKISSGDLTNIPFIKHITKLNKPIILSSGMATLGEIEDAINTINSIGRRDIAVLHCTSNYPASFDSVNLKAMLTIRDAFKVLCGYSDHTEGITIPIAAAALGANIIEKHFTLDKKMPGPDHKASLDAIDLKKMVNNIREIEISLGTGIKKYSQEEIDTMKVARKSIVASKEIIKGEIITEDMLEYKRPGNGVSPKHYNLFIGKRAKVSIKIDEQMNFNMLE